METEANYVASEAIRWARTDPPEVWVSSAPSGEKTSIAQTIEEYLLEHNPFPDDSRVDVLGREDAGWQLLPPDQGPQALARRPSTSNRLDTFSEGSRPTWAHTWCPRPAPCSPAALLPA